MFWTYNTLNTLNALRDFFDFHNDWGIVRSDKNMLDWDSDPMFKKLYYSKKDDAYMYEMLVPGFNKDNLSVEVDNGVLTVKGEREKGNSEKVVINKKMTINDYDKIDAEIKDGILYLKFEAPKHKSDVKRIELK